MFSIGCRGHNWLRKCFVISLSLHFLTIFLGLYTGDTFSQPPWHLLLPAPLFFLFRSCTFNSTECCDTCIPASATAPFHLLASRPLNPIPCSFPDQPPLSLSPLLWRARQMQSAKSEPKLILTSLCGSPGLWGQEHWVCCNVTLVAVTQNGTNLPTKCVFFFSCCTRLKHSYMQTLQNTFIQ